MNKGNVTYENVAQAASAMLQHGTKPTVRAVIAVTGGKTEIVSQFLRDFFEKRNADVLRMADELGSSTIAKLLAAEVQTVVDRRTATLKERIDELTDRLNESIELLAEKEADCQHRIELAEAKATQAIHEAQERASMAESKIKQAQDEAKKAQEDAATAEANALEKIQKAKDHSELHIQNAQNEANALIAAANARTEKAEQETVTLREQVKDLAIDEAKRSIEKQQTQEALAHKDSLKDELAQTKATIAKLEQALLGAEKDIKRLENDNTEYKESAKQLPTALAELNEANKQLTTLREKYGENEKPLSRAGTKRKPKINEQAEV